MNNLLNGVSPNTRGLIWLSEKLGQDNPYYDGVNYLLDGLLTASLIKTQALSSQVVIGNNFGQLFYVFIVQDFVEKEFQSYLELIQTNLLTEYEVIVIDEQKFFDSLLKKVPKEIKGHFRLIK